MIRRLACWLGFHDYRLHVHPHRVVCIGCKKVYEVPLAPQTKREGR